MTSKLLRTHFRKIRNLTGTRVTASRDGLHRNQSAFLAGAYRSFATRPSEVDNRHQSRVGTAQAQSVTLKLLINDESNHPVQIPIEARIGDTLLETAHKNRIDVAGTCDGKLECSTCHCVLGSADIFKQSTGGANAVSDVEQDLLSQAFAVEEFSRLSCKVEVTKEMEGMQLKFPAIAERSRYKHLEKQILSKAASAAASASATVDVIESKKFQNLTKSAIPKLLRQYTNMTEEQVRKYQVIAEVLPFRTNNYVIEELIDWQNYDTCPMFNLTFPKPHMLDGMDDAQGTIAKTLLQIEDKLLQMVRGDPAAKRADLRRDIRELANVIRGMLNPHPAKQKEMNVPSRVREDEKEPLEFERGMQHKYRETVLFFPSESQYCHSYCTYCFRWAQFIGSESLQFASNDLVELMLYLRRNKQVTDLLITGGDPMVLSSEQLRRYLDPIVNDPELAHLTNIRIGSKSLAYWPYKYVTDEDAEGMLDLFRYATSRGKHISFMAHFSHPRELEPPVVLEAIKRLRASGVTIRAQAPLIKNINDDPDVWTRMWRRQVQLGVVPYYMFVERDTGAKNYFGVPLERCLEIYNKAISRVGGLARTARGPSMSCTPGKVCVMGVETVAGEKVFVLRFLQARNPAWNERVFFAKYDAEAKWMDELKPAFGEKEFFWEAEHRVLEELAKRGEGSSGQLQIELDGNAVAGVRQLIAEASVSSKVSASGVDGN